MHWDQYHQASQLCMPSKQWWWEKIRCPILCWQALTSQLARHHKPIARRCILPYDQTPYDKKMKTSSVIGGWKVFTHWHLHHQRWRQQPNPFHQSRFCICICKSEYLWKVFMYWHYNHQLNPSNDQLDQSRFKTSQFKIFFVIPDICVFLWLYLYL